MKNTYKVAMLVMATAMSASIPARADELKLPAEIGRIEGARDMHLFQVEPSVINEDYYTKGKAERHQFVGTTLPAGAPIPDTQGPMPVHVEPLKPGASSAASVSSGQSAAPSIVLPSSKGSK